MIKDECTDDIIQNSIIAITNKFLNLVDLIAILLYNVFIKWGRAIPMG